MAPTAGGLFLPPLASTGAPGQLPYLSALLGDSTNYGGRFLPTPGGRRSPAGATLVPDRPAHFLWHDLQQIISRE